MPRRSTTESNVPTTPSPSPASADSITSVASARTSSASSAWSPTRTPYVAASSSAERKWHSATNGTRESRGAHALPGFVRDDYLVPGHRLAEPQWCGHAGDDARGHALVVGGADLDAHGDASVEPSGVHRGADRAERLGQHAGSPTMQ